MNRSDLNMHFFGSDGESPARSPAYSEPASFSSKSPVIAGESRHPRVNPDIHELVGRESPRKMDDVWNPRGRWMSGDPGMPLRKMDVWNPGIPEDGCLESRGRWMSGIPLADDPNVGAGGTFFSVRFGFTLCHRRVSFKIRVY